MCNKYNGNNSNVMKARWKEATLLLKRKEEEETERSEKIIEWKKKKTHETKVNEREKK